jgi:hypothetical protein
MSQKICALCSPRKTEQVEKCVVPSKKRKSQQTNSLSRKHQIARLLDREMTPQFESLTLASQSGDLSVGTQ